MTRPTLATDTVLRMAWACWCVDPDHGLTLAQQAWVRTRLVPRTPLTPGERARRRVPLLAWCRRVGGARLAAMLETDYQRNDTSTTPVEQEGRCDD